MKGHHFITIAAIVVAAASISYAAGSRAVAQMPLQAGSQPVLVTNTTSQCVPTSIYHSIALPAVQSGPWNVGDVGEKLPFTRDMINVMPGNQTTVADHFVVPAGKRLIIEGASFSSNSFSTQTGTDYATFGVILINGPSGIRESVRTFIQSGPFPAYSVANMQCHLIAEPGDNVYVDFDRPQASTGSGIDCEDTLTGHYVVVP